jgi:Ca-activated chloride channel family protein
MVEDVEITQSHTTKVEIPAPGIANILKKSKGHGAVLLVGKTEVTKILDLNPENLQENIVLQPGNYKVVFRPLNSKKAFYTTEYDFTITSGKSEAIRLY